MMTFIDGFIFPDVYLGCRLLYLPPYLPDFNPIEEAFVFMKAFLRRNLLTLLLYLLFMCLHKSLWRWQLDGFIIQGM